MSLLLLIGPSLGAQAASESPAFPTQVEVVTVDVVVLDEHGRPVRDLQQGDFTLLEDGDPQPIVGFEARVLAPQAEAQSGESQSQDASAPAAQASAGRSLTFLIDDLGIDQLAMWPVVAALSGWLASGADPRDQVNLRTTSGSVQWSDTVANGRADFEAVLGRVRGQRLGASGGTMSDWEAYKIDVEGTPIGSPNDAFSRGPVGAGNCSDYLAKQEFVSRVVSRWFRDGTCPCDASRPELIEQSIRSCRMSAFGRARELYSAATRRSAGLLASIEGLSRGLAATRGRKSIVVLTQGLLRETDPEAYRKALDASRRGNTAVSFVDTRRLAGIAAYGADQLGPATTGELGAVSTEFGLELAGGERLADSTGGTMIRDTNDLGGGVTRLADEASAYYLLGYASERPLDGKWRKLNVRVARPRVQVRARQGFFATAQAQVAALGESRRAPEASKPKTKAGALPTRALDPALLVGAQRDEIPLRIAPQVLDTDPADKLVRVLVAIEAATAALAFQGTGGERNAALDVTVLGLSRDQPQSMSLDSHVTLGLEERAIGVGGWWTFSRELRLPPGPAQVRVLLRDTTTGRSGLAVQRIVVPRANAPYLSSLVLGDALRRPSGRAASPTLVPVARRRFAPRGQLYCAYEVYPAPDGRDFERIPDIRGGYELQREDGAIVAQAPQTPLAMALGAQFSRMLTIPLDGLVPGRYWLTVQTVDAATGVRLEAREGLEIR